MFVLESLTTLSVLFLAGAFGTFVLFLFLGLLALPVTAMLDKSLGKEKALLLYALALLAFTFFVLMPEGPGGRPQKAGKENDVKVQELAMEGDPFQRADFDHDAERNTFRPYSDTRPLVPNDSPANRGINRRVEFVYVRESGSAGAARRP